MQREGGGELGSGSSGGAGTAPPADSAKPDLVQPRSLLVVLRYGSANLLLVLGAAALIIGGWAPWLVLALALVFGSFADEVSGDDDTSLKESRCLFCTLNLYLSLPLVTLLAFLLVRFAAASPSLFEQPFEMIGALWLTGYLFALVGATVAHELTHRSNRLAKLLAYLLLGFTGNASFVIYHIYTHHRQVGTYDDAATARRGERLRTFMARTLAQQFVQAARFEAARLRRKGLSPYSWRNELIVAHLVPLAILVLAWIIGGWNGVIAIFLAGLIGRSFHELINYVQHYGLVRVENSPIRPHHSWDCYRTLSNVLHYNLPRHSDHHMFATKAFWQLNTQPDAPTLPYGYQTMAFIALTPPLWRHIMRKLLADWDERFASDAERKVVRERGWEGVA
jgi:alkane 1-monooxygenase